MRTNPQHLQNGGRRRNTELRELDEMENKGLTQKEFAQRVGCSQQYISRIFKGKENLSIETISKIEAALGVSILEIHF